MSTDTVLTPDAVTPPAAPSPFDALLAGLGMPTVSELVAGMVPPFDPDAVTLDDLAADVRDLTAAVVELRDMLAPVVELANVAKSNAPKLRKFGIVW